MPLSDKGSGVCQPKTRYSTVSRQEVQTKEVGVVFPRLQSLDSPKSSLSTALTGNGAC